MWLSVCLFVCDCSCGLVQLCVFVRVVACCMVCDGGVPIDSCAILGVVCVRVVVLPVGLHGCAFVYDVLRCWCCDLC